MKILVALQVKLTKGEDARLRAKGTDNLEAYLKLLQATEYLGRFNKEGNALARQILEEVIALDPEYPSAYRLLGASHMMDVWLKSSKSPKESMAMAIKLTKKAIALDDFEYAAHSLLGLLYTMTRQYEKGIAEAERAVALNTNSALAHGRLGKVLTFAGRHEEAIALYKKAIRLNPFPQSTWVYGLGLSYLFTGHCQEAIIECEKAVHGRPNDLLAHIALTVAYGLCGREEEARAVATEILRIDPKFSVAYFAKKLTYKNQADKERFIDALHKAGLPE